MQRQGMKDLPLRARIVVRTSNMKICRRRLADCREFKKLRRLLQRKRHIKIVLCVRFRVMRLSRVDHAVQTRRSVLSLALHEWFSCRGKERKIFCLWLALSSELQIWKFHVAFCRLRQQIATKSVRHVQHDYFSSFNQSNHWYVALSLTLPSSNL